MGFGVPSGLAAAVALWKPSGALRADRRGSFAIITAMLGVVLIGTAALAIDVGNWQVNKSAMQGAADQAALAAGFAMPNGTAPVQNEAKGVAAANGFTHGQDGVTVTVATPPSSGSHAGAAGAIQVTIAQPQQRFLSSVVLNTAPTISATAVSASPPANTCLVALAPSGNGITGSGSGDIKADNCNIYVNSNTNPCDVALSGTWSISGYDVFQGSQKGGQACLYGSGSGLTATHNQTFNAKPAVDPYASSKIPAPPFGPCLADTSLTTGSLSPGTYCGGLSFSGTRTIDFTPGVYVFDQGGITTSGTITLTGKEGGVTLVFTSSTGLPPRHKT
jgi:Flp pilus assembly protein TadG